MKKKSISILICMLITIIILPVSRTVMITDDPTGAEISPHQPPIYDTSWEAFQDIGDNDRCSYGRPDYGFLGVNYTDWTPPDPIIAAGPEHLVVMTNGAIAFFQKNGTKDFQDEIEDSYGFWGEEGATNFVFDPEVIYDPHTDRFMAMACERGTGAKSYYLLAVSDDSDPNGDWYKYRFDVTALGGGGDIDSPNVAVDSQAVYLTADFFTGGQKYLVYILEKEPLLSGSTGIIRSMLITGSQSYGIPITYGDAPAMYMIEHFESSSNTKVRLHAITDPLGTPQRVTYDLTVPSYSPPEAPPQKGTTTRPNTFDSRFWSCVWRKGSLWATHHQGSSRVMARWYEIKTNDWPTSGDPELYQSGDIDPGSDIRTFFTAIAPDGYGNAAMCFARSSPNEYISIARCTRLSNDPLGTMRDVVIVKNSSAPYNVGRWGDYSGVSCDPSDNRTFWMHGEYTPGGNIWNTWISKCIAPNQTPNTPSTPSGPDEGVTDIEYMFTTNTTDYEGDPVYYIFDWGDGTFSDWLGPYESGATANASHIWTHEGDFDIKAKAKDEYGESDWSDPHTITIIAGPKLEIGIIRGGLLKVSASIENAGAVDATGVNWSITLDGGAFIGKVSEGTDLDIPAGGNKTVTSKFIFGFGSTTVSVTADITDGISDTRKQGGFVFLLFIKVNPGGGA
ncbi:MAG: PKD domain-containing protein [Thermoplasmatales archaeon]|nr:MAG: PKD domain-containing protein [Thermoplasmatales archaeon]